MRRIKEQILRQFGDHGADTLRRYFIQIEYTAYWCIRMLRRAEGIESVIPEGVEDIVVVRLDRHELRQTKTRDESQGPWSLADVLPILCAQYHRRKAFASTCRFHFVSDQVADNTSSSRAYGRLFRLKFLLDVERDGQELKDEECQELLEFEERLIPKICELIKTYGEEIDPTTAKALLHDTQIETDSESLRNITNQNLAELEEALSEYLPGTPELTMSLIKQVYVRLVVLIARRIIDGMTLEERAIRAENVIECWAQPTSTAEVEYPDLAALPGRTRLDKKTRFGGFHATELPSFHKQRALAEWTRRKLKRLGLEENLEHLTTAIVDLQATCRRQICLGKKKQIQNPGPQILEMLRPKLPELAKSYFPDTQEVDDQFCLGLLWNETDLCTAWWHSLDNQTGGMKT